MIFESKTKILTLVIKYVTKEFLAAITSFFVTFKDFGIFINKYFILSNN